MTYRDLIFKNILDEAGLVYEYCQQASIEVPGNAKVFFFSFFFFFLFSFFCFLFSFFFFLFSFFFFLFSFFFFLTPPQELLQEIEDGNVRDLSGDTCSILKEVWETPAIQEALESKVEFQLNDSAAFFFENLERIGAANYVPEYSDILR